MQLHHRDGGIAFFVGFPQQLDCFVVLFYFLLLEELLQPRLLQDDEVAKEFLIVPSAVLPSNFSSTLDLPIRVLGQQFLHPVFPPHLILLQLDRLGVHVHNKPGFRQLGVAFVEGTIFDFSELGEFHLQLVEVIDAGQSAIEADVF